MAKGIFEVADSVFCYENCGVGLYIGYPSSVDLFSGNYDDWEEVYAALIENVSEFFSRGLNRW